MNIWQLLNLAVSSRNFLGNEITFVFEIWQIGLQLVPSTSLGLGNLVKLLLVRLNMVNLQTY